MQKGRSPRPKKGNRNNKVITHGGNPGEGQLRRRSGTIDAAITNRI